MITHEEAKECISRLFDSYIYGDFIPFPTRSDLDTLSLYINQQEALQSEHKALKLKNAKVTELLGLYQIKDTLIEEYQVNDGVIERQQTLGALQSVREEIEIKNKELEEMK